MFEGAETQVGAPQNRSNNPRENDNCNRRLWRHPNPESDFSNSCIQVPRFRRPWTERNFFRIGASISRASSTNDSSEAWSKNKKKKNYLSPNGSTQPGPEGTFVTIPFTSVLSMFGNFLFGFRACVNSFLLFRRDASMSSLINRDTELFFSE